MGNLVYRVYDLYPDLPEKIGICLQFPSLSAVSKSDVFVAREIVYLVEDMLRHDPDLVIPTDPEPYVAQPGMILRYEFEREEDGRWIIEDMQIPGVMVYADTLLEGFGSCQNLAYEVNKAREDAKNDVVADDFNYEQLDPGIRKTVRVLRNLGYKTTDSGDGVSKFAGKSDEEKAELSAVGTLSMPHVFINVEDPRDLQMEADQLWALVETLSKDGPSDLEPRIEAVYWPQSNLAMLCLFDFVIP